MFFMFKDRYTLIALLVLTGAMVWAYDSEADRKIIRVAVLDSGVNVKDPRIAPHLCKDVMSEDFTGEGLKDRIGHGTHIIGSIIKYAGNSNYCIFVYKVWNSDNSATNLTQYYSSALNRLKNQKVDLINYSGEGESPYEFEKDFLYSNPEVKWIVAAGNEGKDIDKYPVYPASYAKTYKNVFPVASFKDGVVVPTSNYGNVVKYFENGVNVRSYALDGGYKVMSGTSMATSIVTGKLIKEMSK